MDNVSASECQKEHKRVDENMERAERRLNDHSNRIDSVEAAVLKLTILVDSIGKKSIFDKILTVSVFIIAVVLLAVILGPEYVGKVIGGLK
jgi:K+-sensing histidine kinase KdpD